LIPIYEERKISEIKILEDKINKNKKLFLPTTFEIMDKDTKENVHSNVLKYLLKEKTNGHKILISLLKQITGKQKDKVTEIISKIENSNYEVIREKDIKGKRIDLFIKTNDFYIAIENKFYARLHYVDEKNTQTDFYYKELNKQYPDMKSSLFIILDYKDTEECYPYDNLNYNHVLNTLNENEHYFSDDHIFIEYRLLLTRLLNGIDNISIDNLFSQEISLSKIISIKEEFKNGNFKTIT
jgi:hypothetical protein